MGKTIESERKHRIIKLVRTERKGNYLQSKLNYHVTKLFIENVLTTEMKKRQILMNKPIVIYFGLSIEELFCKLRNINLRKLLRKLLKQKFWYDYVNPKYDKKGKLCCLDTDCVQMKSDNIYKDFAKDVETRFDNSNY